MNKTIVELIAASNFLADATQVERLASSVVSGQQADGTYLRVVLAHMKNALGKSRRRKDAQAHETVLNSIHDDLYPAVLSRPPVRKLRGAVRGPPPFSSRRTESCRAQKNG